MKRITAAILIVSVLLSVFNFVRLKADQNQTTQCLQFGAKPGNYLFDDFETHEYISGFLAIHFKLKTPYNDGRGWSDNLIAYQQNCNFKTFTKPNPKLSGVRPQMQFYSIRFTSLTHYDLWDDELDQMIVCDGCSVDFPETLDNGFNYSSVAYQASIDGGAAQFNSGSFPIKDNPGVSKNPLIIVPGIMATELNYVDQNVWPNPGKMLLDLKDDFLDDLKMNGSGVAVNPAVKTGQVIGSINYGLGKFDYIDPLAKDLEANGYQPNLNLYLFSYDWRKNVSEISLDLKKKIDLVLSQSGASKVDILAHSYGGLIAKKYILENRSAARIDRAIFAGTPNLGAADAAKALLFGDNFNMPFLNSAKILELAQNMPGIYDLLPSAEYFKHIAGYYDDITSPANKSILNYEQSKSFLLGLGKNADLINRSESLHSSEFDNLDFAGTGIETFNVVGCGTYTTKTITKMYYGNPSLVQQLLNQPKYRIYSDSGDGTVLLQSAQDLKAEPGHLFYVTDTAHNQLLVPASVRNLILSLLNRKTPQINSSEVIDNPASCAISGKLVSLPNSIELTISDPQTQRVLIPGVDYIEKNIGNDSEIFLPAKKLLKYSVKAKKPAANKPVSIVIKNYNNQKTANYYDNITIKGDLVLNINSPDSAGQDIPDQVSNVDENGNSSPVQPSYTETDDQGDTTAPQTKIQRIDDSFQISKETLILTSTANKIKFIGTDDKSGLFDTEYSFDNGTVWNLYNQNDILTVPSETENILFFSRDKALNIEELKDVSVVWLGALNNPTNQNNQTNPQDSNSQNNPAPPSQTSDDSASNENQEAVPNQGSDQAGYSDSGQLKSTNNSEGSASSEEQFPKTLNQYFSIPQGSAQAPGDINITLEVPDFMSRTDVAGITKNLNSDLKASSVNFYSVQPGFFHSFLNFLLNLIFF